MEILAKLEAIESSGRTVDAGTTRDC